MGFLHYGGGYRFEFEDRLLAHLRTVILGKYVLQESMIFTWVDFGEQRSIWLHPNFPLQFEFDRETTPELNPEWIDRLNQLASSPGGLRLIDEFPGKGWTGEPKKPAPKKPAPKEPAAKKAKG